MISATDVTTCLTGPHRDIALVAPPPFSLKINCVQMRVLIHTHLNSHPNPLQPPACKRSMCMSVKLKQMYFYCMTYTHTMYGICTIEVIILMDTLLFKRAEMNMLCRAIWIPGAVVNFQSFCHRASE